MSEMSNKTVLVLGASGMLGSAVFRLFSESSGFITYGSLRGRAALRHFDPKLTKKIIIDVDVENQDQLIGLFAHIRPHIVINCIGLIKQVDESNDPLLALPINSILPHRLSRLASLCGARFIHISTDCVFSGDRGNYKQTDVPDATDLYGRSKLLGEVDCENSVTLRTSIVGHELADSRSLIGWFLKQKGSVRGFTRAVFSGLPTVELARVIRDQVIPHPELRGLWHVSSNPIAKYDLLELVKNVYGMNIEIIPDPRLVIDRSLDSSLFRKVTGWQPAPWTELVASMHQFG